MLTEPGARRGLRAELLRYAIRGEGDDRAGGARLGAGPRRGGRRIPRSPTSPGPRRGARRRAVEPSRDARWSSVRASSRGAAWGSETRRARSCPPKRGSTTRTVSFTKGCYPGQEPIARLRYRGQVQPKAARPRNRGGSGTGDEMQLDGKAVGAYERCEGKLALRKAQVRRRTLRSPRTRRPAS